MATIVNITVKERSEGIVDLLVVQVGESPVQRHTGDHDDDRGNGQGHAREARPARHEHGEETRSERREADASRSGNTQLQVQRDTSRC